MPVYTSEGIVLTGRTPQEGWVSLTTIKAFDLLSEGPIEGIVTGIYTFSGTMGNIGWNRVDISGFDNPPSTVSGQILRSIYWNEVPVVNSENKFNFQNVSVAYSDGSPTNSINGYITDELTVSRTLNERLRYGIDFAKIYRIYNNNCKSVIINIKFNSLSKVDPNIGDTQRTTVNYNIYYRKITSSTVIQDFILAKTESVEGNISQGYIRTSRIDLPTNSDLTDLGYEIKILRTTTDSIDTYTRNVSAVESLTEIYGNTYSYPYSAIVKSEYTAESFAQIPNRAFDTKLLKVRIPNNYDPLLKTYDGVWDGDWERNSDQSLKLQWTDNPAWCFYDLITNKRYGLGNYIDESLVDKWTLYEIARYCDTLVPDGYGGVEPRFACNLLLSSREEAYKVINDMASIFRAMTYYCGGGIFVSQDVEKDLSKIYCQFTNANVENGDFNYSSTSRRVRHTVAVVRYNDKRNFYRPAIEYVEDVDGIKRYGIREVELTAYGCTSRGQAVRFGRWALLSEILQTETISFIGGYEAALLRPGDVFKVVDFHRNNTRYAGRTLNITNNASFSNFKLDSTVTGFVSGEVYKLSVLTPTFFYDPITVTNLDSNDIDNIRRGQVQTLHFSGFQASGISGNTYITCVTPFTGISNALDVTNYSISGYPVWSLEAFSGGNLLIPDDVGDYYKAIKIEEKEDFKFNVTAVEYISNKYTKIESGLAFELPKTYYTDPPSTSPSSLSLTRLLRTPTPNTQSIDYVINCPQDDKLGGFYVYVKGGSDLTNNDVVGGTYLQNIIPASAQPLGGRYVPTTSNTYYFRAYSFSLAGTKSANFASNNIEIFTKPILDVGVSGLSLQTGHFFGLSGVPPTAPTFYRQITRSPSPVFKWETNIDEAFATVTGLSYIVTVCPQNDNLTSPNLSKIIHRQSGFIPVYEDSPEFTFGFNTHAFQGKGYDGEVPPYRDYDIFVEAINHNGESSSDNYTNTLGFSKLSVINPPITGFYLTTGNGAVKCNYDVYTNQRITTDSDLRIDINNFDNLPSDLVGGFIYFSDYSFDDSDLENALKGNMTFTDAGITKPIQSQKVHFISNANYIPMNPPLTGRDYGNLALTLFDTYDKYLVSVTGNRNLEKRLDLPSKSTIVTRQNISFSNRIVGIADIKVPRKISLYSLSKNIPNTITNSELSFINAQIPSWISVNNISLVSSINIANIIFETTTPTPWQDDNIFNDYEFKILDDTINAITKNVNFNATTEIQTIRNDAILNSSYSIQQGNQFYNPPFVFIKTHIFSSDYVLDWFDNDTLNRCFFRDKNPSWNNTNSFACSLYSYSSVRYSYGGGVYKASAYRRVHPIVFYFDEQIPVNNTNYIIDIKCVKQETDYAILRLTVESY